MGCPMIEHGFVSLIEGVSLLLSDGWIGKWPYISEVGMVILQLGFYANEEYKVLNMYQLKHVLE